METVGGKMMFGGRESNFDKAVKTNNDFERRGKLLTTSKLAEEAGVGGKYLQVLKEKLRAYSVADSIEFHGAEYWFSVKRIAELGKPKLLLWIEQAVAAELREHLLHERKATEQAKQEFLNSRKIEVCDLFVRCSSCRKEIKTNFLWKHGSMYFAHGGLDSVVGSVCCDSCNKELFYCMIDLQHSREIPEDKIMAKASEIGISKEELLPNTELNKNLTKKFNSVGGKGEFIFWQK